MMLYQVLPRDSCLRFDRFQRTRPVRCWYPSVGDYQRFWPCLAKPSLGEGRLENDERCLEPSAVVQSALEDENPTPPRLGTSTNGYRS